MKAIVVALLLCLIFSLFGRADDTQFVVATRNQEGVPLIEAKEGKPNVIPNGWRLEVGETFILVRYISQSAMDGGPEDPSDRAYALVQADKDFLIIKASCLAVWPKEDNAKAAAQYAKLVEENRSVEAEASKPRVRVYHRAAVDPKEEAYILRKSQAIEAGASQSELTAIDNSEQLRQMTEELRRIRQQQVIFSGQPGQTVIQYGR